MPWAVMDCLSLSTLFVYRCFLVFCVTCFLLRASFCVAVSPCLCALLLDLSPSGYVLCVHMRASLMFGAAVLSHLGGACACIIVVFEQLF